MNRSNITNAISSSPKTTTVKTTLAEEAAYTLFQQNLTNFIVLTRLCMGCLGAIGSVLLFFTFFRNKRFSEPCFLCYKAIAVASLLYAMCEIVTPAYRVTVQFDLPLRNYAQTDLVWSWLRFVGCQALYMASAHWSIHLTVFLSIQRGLATLMPLRFRRLDNRSLCIGAVVLVFVTTTAYSLPHVFIEGVELGRLGRYAFVKPSTSSYEAYLEFENYIRILQVPAVAISSAVAIAGLVKAYVLGRRLRGQISPLPGSQSHKDLRAARRNLRLCYLQLIQAIPAIIFCTFSFVAHGWFDVQLIYDERRHFDVPHAYAFSILWALLALSDSLSNDLHFYLFLAFSTPFRKAFGSRFLNWKLTSGSEN